MMKIRFTSFVLAFMLAFTLAQPVMAGDYNARSYLLMEASTGRVLLEENADEALPPASVTKIMTLLVVMDAIAEGKLSLSDTVQVSEYAASMGGSQVYLEPGEEMRVDEMLKCVVIASANDAAVALAEAVAGSEESFVALMNDRAAGLGMKNTVFMNTNGLDDDVVGHLTTARDIALMSRELITKYPEILEYSSIWMDSIRNGAFGLTNTNRLVRFYKGANGLKTGSTSKARFCMSATALRDGMQLIAVVMASPTRDDRNETAKKLLDYGFASYEIAEIDISGSLAPVKVLGGTADAVPLSCDGGSVLLEKGQKARLESKIYIPEYIKAPTEAGNEVGMAEFFVGNEKVFELPIKAAENVKRLGYTELFLRLIKRIAMVSLKY